MTHQLALTVIFDLIPGREEEARSSLREMNADASGGLLPFAKVPPSTPLGPAPWFTRVAGGIVIGACLARLGWSLRARDEVASPATRVAPARST
jgi:hypothetical protein